MPTRMGGRRIVDLVINDLRDRMEVGIERYGTPLQAHNGRNALVDAYQEALDMTQYLRQKIEEEAPGTDIDPEPDYSHEHFLQQLSLPAHWLMSTQYLQEQVYGYPRMGNEGDLAVIATYLDWNQSAAVQELAELREEFSWKPWATDDPFVHRERIMAEAVDLLHFVGNMMHAIGATDAEFWGAYRDKQLLNVRRQESGTYSAQKGGLAEGSDNG